MPCSCGHPLCTCLDNCLCREGGCNCRSCYGVRTWNIPQLEPSGEPNPIQSSSRLSASHCSLCKLPMLSASSQRDINYCKCFFVTGSQSNQSIIGQYRTGAAGSSLQQNPSQEFSSNEPAPSETSRVHHFPVSSSVTDLSKKHLEVPKQEIRFRTPSFNLQPSVYYGSQRESPDVDKLRQSFSSVSLSDPTNKMNIEPQSPQNVEKFQHLSEDGQGKHFARRDRPTSLSISPLKQKSKDSAKPYPKKSPNKVISPLKQLAASASSISPYKYLETPQHEQFRTSSVLQTPCNNGRREQSTIVDTLPFPDTSLHEQPREMDVESNFLRSRPLDSSDGQAAKFDRLGLTSPVARYSPRSKPKDTALPYPKISPRKSTSPPVNSPRNQRSSRNLQADFLSIASRGGAEGPRGIFSSADAKSKTTTFPNVHSEPFYPSYYTRNEPCKSRMVNQELPRVPGQSDPTRILNLSPFNALPPAFSQGCFPRGGSARPFGPPSHRDRNVERDDNRDEKDSILSMLLHHKTVEWISSNEFPTPPEDSNQATDDSEPVPDFLPTLYVNPPDSTGYLGSIESGSSLTQNLGSLLEQDIERPLMQKKIPLTQNESSLAQNIGSPLARNLESCSPPESETSSESDTEL